MLILQITLFVIHIQKKIENGGGVTPKTQESIVMYI